MITDLEIKEMESRKTGGKYKALFITFKNGYKKMVILNDSEVFMLEQLGIKEV